MAEIKLSFDLTFSRRFIRVAGVIAVMLCAVPELESESVTLSTYYPAPSGVYTQMITTGNTYLSRDAGSVGIGTAAPATKLDVVGVTRTQKLVTTANNVLATGDPYAADLLIGSDQSGAARHDASIMLWSAASALRLESTADVLYINTWNQDANGGAGTYNVALAAAAGAISTFRGPVSVTQLVATGPIQARQGAAGPCTGPFTYTYPSPVGGTVALCGGAYVTLTDGIYAKYTIIPVVPANSTNPQITYRCCPCPSGGCSGM